MKCLSVSHLFSWTRILICILVLGYMVPVNAQSSSTEDFTAMPYRYRVKKGKTVKIRALPDVNNGKKIGTVSYPDLIYVENDSVYTGSGYNWVPVSGGGYIVVDYLDKIDNPYYVDQSQPHPTVNVARTHSITKWVLLALCVGFFIVLLCTNKPLKENWRGRMGEPDANGMVRLFMFNKQPYMIVIWLSLLIASSILASLATLLGVGGVVFVLLWIIKILLIILVWVGIIMCVIGIIATLCGVFPAIILAIIGGIVWYYDDSLESFGESCVDTGLSFFNEVNMLSYTYDLFTQYWSTALYIILFPLALFVAFAVLALLFAGSIMFIEKCITMYYNMKYPCPVCHEPSEPAIYLSKGNPLPVRLRPGLYGLFRIKHPVTGEQMATMYFNGRDKLPRKCPHCGNVINAKVGEEKHFTLVGLPESGKSTLVYRIIGEMMRAHSNVEFTDEVELPIRRAVEEVVKTGKFGSVVEKTAVRRRRSIQLTVHRTGVPYRLFVNDVAGELFTKAGMNYDSVPFFKDIQSVIFLYDPFTANVSTQDLGSNFKAWYESEIGPVKDSSYREELDEAFVALKNILENKGNKTSKVHFNFVLVKKDTGYMKGVNAQDESQIKQFVQQELGLAAEMSNIESDYASVNYYAVSAFEPLDKSNIEPLYKGVMNQINLKL